MNRLRIDEEKNRLQPCHIIYQALVYTDCTKPRVLLAGDIRQKDIDFLSEFCDMVFILSRSRQKVYKNPVNVTFVDHLDALRTDNKFDIVFLSKFFNYEAINIHSLLNDLLNLTNLNGLHVLEHVLDSGHINEVGLKQYKYFLPSKYMDRFYRNWFLQTSFEGIIPGESSRKSVLIAKKLAHSDISKVDGFFPSRAVLLIAFFVFLFSQISPIHVGGVEFIPKMVVWPIYILNVILSIAFGFYGLLVSILQTSLLSLFLYGLKKKVLLSVVANVLQYATVSFSYRKLLKNSYWSQKVLSFKSFFIYAGLYPLLLGSAIGGLAFMKELSIENYLSYALKWFLSGFPLVLCVGWPLYSQIITTLNREGLTIKKWLKRV